MSKVIKICPNCGNQFETYGGKKGKTYCSNECYKEHKGIGVKKFASCVVCGKEFELKHGMGTKVCSTECLKTLRSQLLSKPKKTSICKNCGKTFEQLYTTSEANFCCRECYWEYRNTHKNDFEYVSQKRISNTHETRVCEMCGNEFIAYKKTPKRFCSDKCRVAYSNTEEYRNKRLTTMLERYGKASVGNGMSSERLAEIERTRLDKYQKLCDKSSLDIIEYVDKHVIRVRCRKCGGEFITNNLSYLPYDVIFCKNCSEEYKSYKPAVKIYDLLNICNIEYVKNNRQIIKPYELDIFIPSLNLAFEINGNFWHSELIGKDKNYHINKTKLCYENGIKLVHIFEDEIVNKWNIVESRIKSIIGKSLKLYARKCSIVEISGKDKKDFMYQNHIQGDANSSINIGLKHENELVAVMTLSKERVIYNGKSADGQYELIRYANKCGITVVGGFSRLLNYFITKYSPCKIKTFCDIRWSGLNHAQTVYSKCGFTYINNSKPNYWYMYKTDVLTRKHRYNFTKHSILKKHPELDSALTEWELMKKLGFNRIWDCGNMRFELSIINKKE